LRAAAKRRSHRQWDLDEVKVLESESEKKNAESRTNVCIPAERFKASRLSACRQTAQVRGFPLTSRTSNFNRRTLLISIQESFRREIDCQTALFVENSKSSLNCPG